MDGDTGVVSSIEHYTSSLQGTLLACVIDEKLNGPPEKTSLYRGTLLAATIVATTPVQILEETLRGMEDYTKRKYERYNKQIEGGIETETSSIIPRWCDEWLKKIENYQFGYGIGYEGIGIEIDISDIQYMLDRIEEELDHVSCEARRGYLVGLKDNLTSRLEEPNLYNEGELHGNIVISNIIDSSTDAKQVIVKLKDIVRSVCISTGEIQTLSYAYGLINALTGYLIEKNEAVPLMEGNDITISFIIDNKITRYEQGVILNRGGTIYVVSKLTKTPYPIDGLNLRYGMVFGHILVSDMEL